MDLADFLARKLESSTYRDLEQFTGVSRGSLEVIIKRENKELPEIKTLGKIARAYGLPLWEVMRLAGVDLDLPKSQTEIAQRLGALADKHPEIAPALTSILEKLVRRYDTDPNHVIGIVIGLEAALGPNGNGTTV